MKKSSFAIRVSAVYVLTKTSSIERGEDLFLHAIIGIVQLSISGNSDVLFIAISASRPRRNRFACVGVIIVVIDD